jgi:hypothetical protein
VSTMQSTRPFPMKRAPEPSGSPLESLLAEWRADADRMRRYGHEATATVCELHARQVEAAMAAMEAEALTLVEAAEESGLSADHLGRLLRTGAIPNAGRKGAPRIRRGDLPRSPRRPLASASRADYDPITDARALKSRR